MKKSILVTQLVEVEINESFFSEEFLKEFREVFYNFHTINDHMKHIAQLSARGLIGSGSVPEGYCEGMIIGHSPEVIEVEMEN